MAGTQAAEGKLYICAVKDVCSRRIVGYSMGSRMSARLAVDALVSAVSRRGSVTGCIDWLNLVSSGPPPS
ncbi:hypothetical protein CYJ75_12590 [Kocuria rhizophila]|nr:hypothetical protein CYJ75_12590 [Kocuria rhizophila]